MKRFTKVSSESDPGVRQVICHPCYPYFYKTFMLQVNKNHQAI